MTAAKPTPRRPRPDQTEPRHAAPHVTTQTKSTTQI